MRRLTERDEYGNADVIAIDSADWQLNLNFDEFNRVTDVLNRLAAYEDNNQTPEEQAAMIAENAALQADAASCQQVKNAIIREGFTDIETMIAKYKIVLLAANETSIEQDNEIESLQSQLADAERRERAAVEDLQRLVPAWRGPVAEKGEAE